MTFECQTFGYCLRVSAASPQEAVGMFREAGLPGVKVARVRGGDVIRDLQELRREILAARRRIQSVVR